MSDGSDYVDDLVSSPHIFDLDLNSSDEGDELDPLCRFVALDNKLDLSYNATIDYKKRANLDEQNTSRGLQEQPILFQTSHDHSLTSLEIKTHQLELSISWINQLMAELQQLQEDISAVSKDTHGQQLKSSPDPRHPNLILANSIPRHQLRIANDDTSRDPGPPEWRMAHYCLSVAKDVEGEPLEIAPTWIEPGVVENAESRCDTAEYFPSRSDADLIDVRSKWEVTREYKRVVARYQSYLKT
jgi:hypothetical protein